MTISATTHLNLPGTARQALGFYRSVFGGEVAVTTYGELGMPAEAPDADRVVFGQLESVDGLRLMAYDVPGRTEAFAGTTARSGGATVTDQPFFVAVRGDTLEELTSYWDRLGEGATIVEPLAASAWSAGFGMLTDRFGVTWVLDVASSGGG
ncbi:MAG: VOC family protein [Desertimonas sp.]